MEISLLSSCLSFLFLSNQKRIREVFDSWPLSEFRCYLKLAQGLFARNNSIVLLNCNLQEGLSLRILIFGNNFKISHWICEHAQHLFKLCFLLLFYFPFSNWIGEILILSFFNRTLVPGSSIDYKYMIILNKLQETSQSFGPQYLHAILNFPCFVESAFKMVHVLKKSLVKCFKLETFFQFPSLVMNVHYSK
jgi:hypothetical protein